MGSLVMTTKRVVEERRVEISVVKAVGEQEEPTTQDKKAVVEVAAVVEKGGEQPPQVVGVQLPSRASRKEAQDKKPEEVTEETGRMEGKEKIMGEEGQENRKRGRKKGQKRRKVVGGGGGEGAYKRYVYRVLKQVHPELSVSSKAMAVLEGLMKDMFERLVEEAARLCKYSGKATLTSRDIQGAVRLVLPGELGKHAVAEGTKAVVKYMDAD